MGRALPRGITMTALKSFKAAIYATALGLLALASGSANAATATTTFAVNSTVVATCTISATAMAFGNYTGVVADTTSTISTTCTNTTPYQIGLDAGTGTGATVAARSMTGAGVLLAYGLYSDATHTTNWGNTPGTDTPASVTATGAVQTVTVYGEIAAGLYVAPGVYADTITATITY